MQSKFREREIYAAPQHKNRPERTRSEPATTDITVTCRQYIDGIGMTSAARLPCRRTVWLIQGASRNARAQPRGKGRSRTLPRPPLSDGGDGERSEVLAPGARPGSRHVGRIRRGRAA